MAHLRDLLGQYLQVPGVRAAVLAGRDGLLVEAAGRGDPRVFEALGALGASALGSAEALGQELGGGATVGAILEYGSALVCADPLGDYAEIVTLADNAASLARIRQTSHSVRGDLLRALDAQ